MYTCWWYFFLYRYSRLCFIFQYAPYGYIVTMSVRSNIPGIFNLSLFQIIQGSVLCLRKSQRITKVVTISSGVGYKWTKFHDSPSNSCWEMSLKNANFNLMEALEEKPGDHLSHYDSLSQDHVLYVSGGLTVIAIRRSIYLSIYLGMYLYLSDGQFNADSVSPE